MKEIQLNGMLLFEIAETYRKCEPQKISSFISS